MLILLMALTTIMASPQSRAESPEETPSDPAQAVAMADAHPESGTSGVFRIKIAAVERTPYALYLNSDEDYRSPGDLTFHVKPAAAHALEKRFGAKPEELLRGKTVTVRGEVRAILIANTVGGRPRSLNRYQHSVLIAHADQVIAVE